ncbi:1,2-diacylglycerol-3-alpha-glucose alpha-1,2-galactosyltransferase [Enterococcus sp. AZ109]
MTLKICMFSKADSVPGQGVGSAYNELVRMLEDKFPSEFEIVVNDFSATTISHYHTVTPQFYFSTFQKKKRGVKIGSVHFLPETLEGSLKLYGLQQICAELL